MEERLLINPRDIVVPGEALAEGMGYLPGRGTYRAGEQVRAGMLGMAELDGKVLKLIPLAGKYLPHLNDRVIGRVIDILLSGWRLEINSAYSGVMNLKDATSEFIPRGADLSRYYGLGDHVVCSIINVTSQKLVDVGMRGPGLRKLNGGRVIEVSAQKVPRIIGKEGSMVEMIKRATGVNVIVGQNGLVWMNGEPAMELIVVNAIRKIEAEAHMAGLTDRMKAWLEQATGKPIPDAPYQPPAEEAAPQPPAGEQRDYPPREGGFREGGFRGGGFRGRGPPRGGRRFGGPRREGGR